MSKNVNTHSAQPDWAKPISTGFVTPSGRKNEPESEWITPDTNAVPSLSHTPDSTPPSSIDGSPKPDNKPDWAKPVSFGIVHPLGYTTDITRLSSTPTVIHAPVPSRPHAGHKVLVPTPEGIVTFGVKTPPPSPGPPPNTPSNKLSDDGVRKRWEIKTPPPSKPPSPTPAPPNTPSNRLSEGGVRKRWEIKTPPPSKPPSPTPAPPNTPSNRMADDGGVRKRWEIKTLPPSKPPSRTPAPPNTPQTQMNMGDGGVKKRWEIKTPPPSKPPSPTPAPPNTPSNKLADEGVRKRWEIKTPPPSKPPSPTPAPPNTPSQRRGVKTPPPSPGPPPNTPSKRGVHFSTHPEYIPIIACGPKLNNARLPFSDREWEAPTPLPSTPLPQPDGIIQLVGQFQVPAHIVKRMGNDGTPPPPPNPPPNTLVKRASVKTPPPSPGSPPNTPSKGGVKTPPPSPGPSPNTPSKHKSRQPREYAWSKEGEAKRASVVLRGGAWPYDDEGEPSNEKGKGKSGVFELDEGEKRKELVKEVEHRVRTLSASYQHSLAAGEVETGWTRGQRIFTSFSSVSHDGVKDKKGKWQATEAQQPLLSEVKPEDLRRWIDAPRIMGKHARADCKVADTVMYLGDDGLEVEVEVLFATTDSRDAPWREELLERFDLATTPTGVVHGHNIVRREAGPRDPYPADLPEDVLMHIAKLGPDGKGLDTFDPITGSGVSLDLADEVHELRQILTELEKGKIPEGLKVSLGNGKGRGRGLKYDPEQDCFIIPGQKHPPGAHLEKKVKVQVDFDDCAPADGKIKWCFYAIRKTNINVGNTYLQIIKGISEMDRKETWTLKCLLAMTSTGAHITRTKEMVHLEELIRAVPVDRLVGPLRDMGDWIRKEMGKLPGKRKSMEILLTGMRVYRQDLVDTMADGQDKTHLREDLDVRIARLEAGDCSAVYPPLDPQSLSSGSLEDVQISEVEEGEFLEVREEKTLAERVKAMGLCLKVFNPATPYNDANFNVAQEMLSEMSAADLATFIRRLRGILGGETGPGANKLYPETVPGVEHDGRKLRETVERIMDSYLMMKHVEADAGLGARPGEGER